MCLSAEDAASASIMQWRHVMGLASDIGCLNRLPRLHRRRHRHSRERRPLEQRSPLRRHRHHRRRLRGPRRPHRRHRCRPNPVPRLPPRRLPRRPRARLQVNIVPTALELFVRLEEMMLQTKKKLTNRASVLSKPGKSTCSSKGCSSF